MRERRQVVTDRADLRRTIAFARPRNTLDESLAALRAANHARLTRFPGHHLFTFAAREIAAVEERMANGPPIDRAFYESLNIGLMCARELEAVDPEYCDLVYAMLEHVRIAAA